MYLAWVASAHFEACIFICSNDEHIGRGVIVAGR